MLHNMGRMERMVRFILGVLLLGLFGVLPSPWRYLTLLGLVMIATAFSGFCPLYRVLGIGRAAPPPG
ncbi:MAG: YgaP family membrane protein [Gemmatimonadales bacterium]